MFRSLLLIVASITIFLVVPQPAAAAGTYTVTPRVIDRAVEQRDMVRETVTITNTSDRRVNVFPSVHGVEANATTSLRAPISPADPERTFNMTGWIEIPRGAVELMPGESATLPLAINVHPQAVPGEYHAVIGFGAGRNRPEAETKVAAGTAPSIVVRLEISDTSQEQLTLGTFTVDRFVFDSNNQSVTYVLENTGDGSVSPTGEIIFYNARGSEVGSVLVNPDELVLAPGQREMLTAQVPTDGVMGRYKAFLTISYGANQAASVYDTAFFYMVPWPQFLAFFVILLCIGTLVMVILHRRYRRPHLVADVTHLPVHVYEGTSESIEHDINLKQS
jgi:hypothetical protein